jgi:hypothetical protein
MDGFGLLAAPSTWVSVSGNSFLRAGPALMGPAYLCRMAGVSAASAGAEPVEALRAVPRESAITHRPPCAGRPDDPVTRAWLLANAGVRKVAGSITALGVEGFEELGNAREEANGLLGLWVASGFELVAAR